MMIFFSIFAPNQRNSVSPLFQVKAAELGQAYLEEISLKRFDEFSPIGNGLRCDEDPVTSCGPISTEEASRVLFDDVDDYHNLNDNPPEDAFGNVRSGFNSFTVNVAVSYAGTDQGLTSSHLKKIQVTVISPENDQIIFTQYKSNF
jgi:MSHA pilin protein MshD